MTDKAKLLALRQKSIAWRAAHPGYAAAVVAKYRVVHKDRYDKSQRVYRENNRDAISRRTREWRSANSERSKVSIKEWIKNNRARHMARIRKWCKEHPEIGNAITARRRAAKVHATPKWANRFFMKEAFHLATLRTKIMGFPWHVDHIVPLKSKIVCGLHVHNNLQVIPGAENLSKGNRYWPDMP